MKNSYNVNKILLLGLSHKTAPVEIREKFSFDESALKKFYRQIRKTCIEEAVYLSTCNRVEIYISSPNYHSAVEELKKLLEEMSGVPREIFSEYIYVKRSKDVMLHLLTVASSLDSMVIGENEILGQVKIAYHNSVQNKCNGILTNRLFHQSFNTAKKVRNQTAISRNLLSVASIAVDKAIDILSGDISSKDALLIGAGEMGELILKYLSKNNIRKISIANRTPGNAQAAAENSEVDAEIIPLEKIEHAAEQVDIIITSVACAEYILTRKEVERIYSRRQGRPLFIIDIAVPRNVDPEAASIDGVTLYNIDDLKNLSDENLKVRLESAGLAMNIISDDTEKLYEWYEGLEIVPMILSMQENLEKIRIHELAKYRKRALSHISDGDFLAIDEMSREIINKILRVPIKAIKHNKALKLNGYHVKETFKKKIRILEDLFKI
jgi:glutamyl-tRNA reductase